MKGIKVISYGYRKTSALTKYAAKEVRNVAKLPSNMRYSYECGKRLAEQNRMGTCKTIKTTSISMLKKGINPSIPGILAGLGAVVPVFGASALGLALGKALQKLIKKI